MKQSEFVAYVDEAGDFGLPGSSPIICMAAWVVHSNDAADFSQRLLELRQEWLTNLGFPLGSEVHTGPWLRKLGPHDGLRHDVRLQMIKRQAQLLSSLNADLVLTSVDKRNNRPADFEPFNSSWELLISGIDSSTHGNSCRLVCDEGHDEKVRQILANLPGDYHGGVTADAQFLSSRSSYEIQSADIAATLCYQYLEPNQAVQRLGGRPLITNLTPSFGVPDILEK